MTNYIDVAVPDGDGPIVLPAKSDGEDSAFAVVTGTNIRGADTYTALLGR